MADANIPSRSINIAVFAMGGEGGGVLAEWIVDLAERGGYIVQTTSVPGVAQRTGATNYYLELFPRAAAVAAGKQPVLALIPMPGDVDIMIASELMEAGRAIQREFVTPDRTTLITSTHRVYAMTEKIALADGRVSETALLEGCEAAAKRLIAFDMAAIAEATGSVISAVMFGALAGAQALPFPRPAFEAAIRRGGVGVERSLMAFAAGFEAAASGATPKRPETQPAHVADTAPLSVLHSELPPDCPAPAVDIVRAGLDRTADYQGMDYARLYLARLRPFIELEHKLGDGSGRLLAETARQLALGMAYEDTVRVAELKIRPTRFTRVREEVRLADGQLLDISEYLHPRVQEIADTLPAGLGRWLLRTGWARALLGRMTSSGRVVKTTSLRGFLLLYLVAAMKPWRPRSLRFVTEQERLEQWLEIVRRTAAVDYLLAAEVAEARNMVRGYGDTHERGLQRFETLMRALPHLSGGPDAAARFATLRKAAQADETGAALASAMAQLPTLPLAAE